MFGGVIVLATITVLGHLIWDAFFRYQAYGLIVGRVVDVPAAHGGFVKVLHVREGDIVVPGQLLVTLINLELSQRLDRVSDELKIATYTMLAPQDAFPDLLEPKQERIESLQTEMRHLRELLAQCELRAPVGGRIVKSHMFAGECAERNAPLIHHYACAHVAQTEEFEQQDHIVCPKCRAKNLIVGADFEYLNGPFICGDCGWSDTDLELVGHCRVCHLCFPKSVCPEEEVVGYHVKRLDPLVLIDAV